MKKPRQSPPHLVVSEELNEIINKAALAAKQKKVLYVDDLLRLALKMRRLLPSEE